MIRGQLEGGCDVLELVGRTDTSAFALNGHSGIRKAPGRGGAPGGRGRSRQQQ